MWKFLFAGALLVAVGVCAHDSRHVVVLDNTESAPAFVNFPPAAAASSSSPHATIPDTPSTVAPDTRCEDAVQSAQMMRRGINDISVRANCN